MSRTAAPLLAVAAVAVALLAALPPIAQDPGYHRLADSRRLLGVANFWNVASNLAFLAVGLAGLARLPRLAPAVPATAYTLFCVLVCLVSAGSAYYHLRPDNGTLVWDRLPIAAAFMALFAMLVADRVDARAGRALLWPLVLAGIASVLYWHVGELRGSGDLRPYLLVQFLPVLSIPVLLWWRPQGALHAPDLWLMLAAYALAKGAEHLDGDILAATGLVSGHTLKHLLAALAVLAALRAVPCTAGHAR